MCGIFFLINGVKFELNKFNFNLFELYVKSPFVESNPDLKKQVFGPDFDFKQYIKENNLFQKHIDLDQVKQKLIKRGPDYFETKSFDEQDQEQVIEINNYNLINEKGQSGLIMASSILHLRGKFVKQPMIEKLNKKDEQKDLNNKLVYNGEIYDSKDEKQKVVFNPFENDSQQIFDLLNKNSLEFIGGENKDYLVNLRDKIKCLRGDFAFVFEDQLNQKIVVGKDIFGKRSLLLGFHENGFIFSSTGFQEEKNKLIQDEDLQSNDQDEQDFDLDKKDLGFVAKKYFLEFLSSKQKQWLEIPGNLIIVFDKKTYEWDSIDLIDDFFTSEKQQISKELMPFEKIEHSIIKKVNEQLFSSVKVIVQNIIGLENYFKGESKEKQKDFIQDAKIAILFSGGIDSALLAFYIDKIIPINETIDLINIVFQKDASDRKTGIEAFKELQKLSPQRNYRLILVDKTLQELNEFEDNLLQLIYPKQTHMDFNIAMILHLASKGEGQIYDPTQILEKKDQIKNQIHLENKDQIKNQINFQNKDQTQKQLKQEQTQIEYIIQENSSDIKDEINQNNETILNNQNCYKSKAKILISGLGADEIFGGYSRYKNAYRRGGFGEQFEEMKFDINRLWIRNLGRDDRAISDNGVEIRFPFLDLELARFVWGLDIQNLTDFSEEGMKGGYGQKRLLRLVALFNGLEFISRYPKKAIQFGTRLANQKNRQTFGSNRKGKGTTEYIKKK